MDTHRLEEIERQIELRLEDIADTMDRKYAESIEDGTNYEVLDHLVDSAISDPERTLRLLANALSDYLSTNPNDFKTFSHLGGGDIVKLLLNPNRLTDEEPLIDVVNKAIDCTNNKASYGPVMPAYTIAYVNVGETAHFINVKSKPDLFELMSQLPKDHDSHLDAVTYMGYPCDQACLVLDPKTFLAHYEDEISSLLLDQHIQDTLY